MSVEIERKFLVTGSEWRSAQSTYYCQGYLNTVRQRTVRIRIAGDRGVLTIKGITSGLSRPEFEYDVPVADATEMLKLCDGPLIEKNRYVVEHAGHVWEVDEFLGDNTGLVVAEVELSSENETVEMPAWVGEEVTHDLRYFNSKLSANPYKNWPENA